MSEFDLTEVEAVDGKRDRAAAPSGVEVDYTRRVALLRVREYQREVVESRARFKLLICGRRWGKTTVGLVAASEGHGAPAGEEGHWRGALDGARIGWIVPSEDHPAATEVWGDLKKALGPLAVSASEEQRRIEVAGGGSVQLWSGFNPDTLRGPYFDGAIVDECSLQHERLWPAVRPTLSDYGGWALLLGSVPEDVGSHWFVGLHRYALSESGRFTGWETWRRASWENPQLTEQDLREARETLGVRLFSREYGAELVGAEGGIWKEGWFRFYDPDHGVPAPDEFQRVELFLDAAWRTGIRNDFSSCQAWGRTATGYYLLGELHGKWESPELRRRVAAFREEYARQYPEQSVGLVVEEAGGGAVAAQELREALDFPVIEFEVRGQTKMARAESVTPLAEGGKVWIPDPAKVLWVKAWLQELVGFPQLAHDDRVDACAMALQRLRSYREFIPPMSFVVPPAPDPIAEWERRMGYSF